MLKYPRHEEIMANVRGVFPLLSLRLAAKKSLLRNDLNRILYRMELEALTDAVEF